MREPFFTIANKHVATCGEPPTISNEASENYFGYFENEHGEQWVFVYDRQQKIGELRGGDIGWDTVVLVRDGHAEVILNTEERAWLEACWKAATWGT